MIICFSCWVKQSVTTVLSASAVQMAQPFSARRSGECAIPETSGRTRSSAPASELTLKLAAEALERLGALGRAS
jgi:hypothetical protein